jgi:alkaline phosphatase D
MDTARDLDRRLAELAARPRTRRGVLLGAGGLAAAAALSRLPLDLARASAPSFASDPFALGVASGDPRPRGVVLWTRLAPAPLQPDGGLDPQPIDVRWEVARDEGMQQVVQAGTAVAWPAFAHSVHVEVDGLAPGREWYYRFTAGEAASPVGRTRTAPRGGAAVDELRFAFVSCQNWEDGYFPVLRDVAELDVDFVLHLGDYIYEYGIENGKGPRKPELPAEFAVETTTLEQYRLRHALYKTDPQLRAAHARHPFVVTWDDHEVENDYQGLTPVEGGEPVDFAARRSAGYQAYYEHLPLRAASIPDEGRTRIFRRLRWGRLASFNVLDTRQYRTNAACGDGESPRCAAALDPEQTMTGPAQERWLLRGLDASRAQWNLIAQQVLMAELDHEIAPDAKRFWNDAWDGYPAARPASCSTCTHGRSPTRSCSRGTGTRRSPTTSSSTSTTRRRRRWPASSSRRPSRRAATPRPTGPTTAPWSPSTATSASSTATAADPSWPGSPGTSRGRLACGRLGRHPRRTGLAAAAVRRGSRPPGVQV